MQDVAVREARDLTVTNDQKALIKNTICKDATDAEMQLFFYDCARRNVHPLDKLIHFTKRAGKYTPITSIDFMRQRAQSTEKFAGEDEPLYDTEVGQHPDWCKYSVYRLVDGQRYKWSGMARWNEYYPGEQLGFMWRKMPWLMLAKCAEALALRKAFPAELQGLYVHEEMEQAGASTSPEQSKQTAHRKMTELMTEGAAGDLPAARQDDAQDTGSNAGRDAAKPDNAPAPLYLDAADRLPIAQTVKEIAQAKDQGLEHATTAEQRKTIIDLSNQAMKRIQGKK